MALHTQHENEEGTVVGATLKANKSSIDSVGLLYVSINATGTVVIEGKLVESDAWATLDTITTTSIKAFRPPHIWRARISANTGNITVRANY